MRKRVEERTAESSLSEKIKIFKTELYLCMSISAAIFRHCESIHNPHLVK